MNILVLPHLFGSDVDAYSHTVAVKKGSFGGTAEAVAAATEQNGQQE